MVNFFLYTSRWHMGEGGADVWLHSFLTPASDEAKLSACPQPLYPEGKKACYPLNKRLGGPPQRWSGNFGKDRKPCPCQESNPKLSIPLPSAYVDWAIPVPTLRLVCTITTQRWRILNTAVNRIIRKYECVYVSETNSLNNSLHRTYECQTIQLTASSLLRCFAMSTGK